VKQDGKTGHGQPAQQLLAFAQGIAVQHRNPAFPEGFLAKSDDVSQDLELGRETVIGSAEGGFHDQNPSVPRFARFGGLSWPEFEIARVEQRLVFCLNQGHGASEDMPRRQQGDLPAATAGDKLCRSAKGQNVCLASTAQSRGHETSCRRGEDHLAVPAGMVAVRMADEDPLRPGLLLMRVKPEIEVGQVDATAIILERQARHELKPIPIRRLDRKPRPALDLAMGVCDHPRVGITARQFSQMQERLHGRGRPTALSGDSGAVEPAPHHEVILGLDPSLRGTGYGVIRLVRPVPQTLAQGTIRCPQSWQRSRCLVRIVQTLREVVSLHRPTICAVEGLFYAQNLQTALLMGEVRGAAMAALAEAGLEIVEIAPRKVKQAVVGYGAAQKTAVARMIQRLLHLEELPAADAADALALAWTHCQEQGRPLWGGRKRI
jgi:crossover junction endodeoxyribonuclease RuvC